MENKEKPPLHVVFSLSGAGISEALRQLGSNERVVGFMDDLSFGPIDRASARTSWIANELWFDWDEVCREAEGFWAEVTSPAVAPVAWVSRNKASEYSGFFEFVWPWPTGHSMLSTQATTWRRLDRLAGRWGASTPLKS